MRTKDLMIVALTAVLTMALGLAAYETMTGAIADGELPPPAAQPTIETGGVVITLSFNKTLWAAGDSPVVLLNARNIQGMRADLLAEVSITSERVASPMSRRASLPVKVWSQTCHIALQPGEARTVEVPTPVVLGAGNSFTVTVTAGGKAMSGGFSVPGPNTVAFNKSTSPSSNSTAALTQAHPR